MKFTASFTVLSLLQLCKNNTNDSKRTDTSLQHFEAVGYSTLFLLGLGLNVAALYAFIAKRKSWKDTHVYMLNLNMADFALILYLPFRVYDAIFVLHKSELCTYLILVHYINMYVSILTTTAICVHRYLAIRFPLQAKSWRKKKETAFAVCLLIWLLVISGSTIFWKQNSPGNLWTCFERRKDKPFKQYSWLLLITVGYLTPLLIIVFCSSRILSILSKVNNRSEEKRRVIGIVRANMAVFILCYTPISIAFIVNANQNVPPCWSQTMIYFPAHIYLVISEWIASSNCCFDSISYYFLLSKFYSKAANWVEVLSRAWNPPHFLSTPSFFLLWGELTACLTTINDKEFIFPSFSFQVLWFAVWVCFHVPIQKPSCFL